MKIHHILTLLTAAGILLPAQQAFAITSLHPVLADSVSPAPKKNKKGKKNKKRKGKQTDKTEALAKKIFSVDSEQKKKAANFLKKNGSPDFLSAIKEENDKVVYAHLMTGVNVQDALSLAMQEKKTQYFRLMLKAPGVDVNKRDENNHSLLYIAAMNDNYDCMKILSEAGADVSELNETKCLASAVYNNNIEKVKTLLQIPGMDVKQKGRWNKTLLELCDRFGYGECAAVLLTCPDIDKTGYSPLALTILKDDAKELQQLLKSGTDSNLMIDIRQSHKPLLMYAAQMGRVNCVRLLLSQPGINVNQVDAVNNTPLNMAATHRHSECVKLLLSAPGIDVNVLSRAGTALACAAGVGDAECVRLLLAAPGIDVNKCEEGGCTPLYHAWHTERTNNYRECVKLLLSAPGIDVFKKTKYGISSIDVYIWEDPELAELLIKIPGMDVNKAYDEKGVTPLIFAVKSGNEKLVTLLLKAGADVTVRDGSGKSALDYANDNKIREMLGKK